MKFQYLFFCLCLAKSQVALPTFQAAHKPQVSGNNYNLVTLVFNSSGTSDGQGITLSSNMRFKSTGGGHLYCEGYNDDDFIYFSSPKYVESFEMNAMPWQGYSGGSGFQQNIYALDSGGSVIWSTTVNLSSYRNWSNWLIVSVGIANISTLKFEKPTAASNSRFWPSIDNLIINQ